MPELFVSTIQKYPALSLLVFCFLAIFSIAFFIILIYKKHNYHRLIASVTNGVQILGIVGALIWGSGIIMEHDLQTAKKELKDLKYEIKKNEENKVNLICENKLLFHENVKSEIMKEKLQKDITSLSMEAKKIENEKNKIQKQNKHMKLDWVFSDIYRGIIAYWAAQYKNLLSAVASGDINSMGKISRTIDSISYKDLCNYAIQQIDFSDFNNKDAETIKNYINKKIENNILLNEKIVKYRIMYNTNHKISNTNECIHFIQNAFKLAQDMSKNNYNPDKIFSFFEKIQDELHQKIDKGLL